MMAQSAEVMKYENEDVDLAMLFFTLGQDKDDRETNSILYCKKTRKFEI